MISPMIETCYVCGEEFDAWFCGFIIDLIPICCESCRSEWLSGKHEYFSEIELDTW